MKLCLHHSDVLMVGKILMKQVITYHGPSLNGSKTCSPSAIIGIDDTAQMEGRMRGSHCHWLRFMSRLMKMD